MATKIDLNAEARSLGGHATAEAAVTDALEEYVERRRRHVPSGDRLAILDLIGQIDYDDYDPKAERCRDTHRVDRALATRQQPPTPQ